MNRKQLYLVALGVAGLLAVALVGISIVSAGSGKSSSRALPGASAPSIVGAKHARSLFAGIPQRGTVLGSPRAPVTLVEYADPQCPYCAQWSQDALPALVKEYVRSGRVRIEYRGIAFIGPESKAGVAAALAAGRQGKLWQVVDLLYANQSAENSGWINEDLLGSIAKGADVTWSRFDFDRYSPGVERALKRSHVQAQADGVTGTPSFLAGPTGGRLQPVEITSLGPSAMRPVLDQLLGA